ncbi:hypothetical protein B0H12DRAFT_1274356 [Mycena haematopus]|nr:hypothetical protein B0H12DRAFT_1280426 [Mycena haematopus]KAJ7215218.1 hypothetical protein B0H12DRAFT_1274356 [Mycena haematopus]
MNMNGPNPLPVTTHLLRPDQRVRLMRSTRKMEHLLGETPLFVDTGSPITSTFPGPQSRRSAYIYVAPTRSSSLGVHPPPDDEEAPHASTSHVPARPLLAVRVRTPSDTVDPPIASPVVPPFAHPQSPADKQRRQRTRKMARIFRTLGENVPAELVFPVVDSFSTRPRRTSTLSKRRSMRLIRTSSATRARARRDSLSLANDETETGAMSGEAALESIDSDSESASVYSTMSGGDWDTRVATQPLAMPATPTSDPRVYAPSDVRTPAPSGPRARPSRAPAPAASKPRAYTSTLPRGPASTLPRRPASSQYSPSQPGAPSPPEIRTPGPSAPLASPAAEPPAPPSPKVFGSIFDTHPPVSFPPGAGTLGYDRGTHRKEKGWSGEWVSMGSSDVQNMNEVASRLRGLRLR